MNTKSEYYDNGDFTKHSSFLNKHFNINRLGVDTVNKWGYGFEFKESLQKEKKFLCKKKDLEADFIVFVENKHSFFIVESDFLKIYKFANCLECAVPYLSTIEKIYFRHFTDIKALKKFIREFK